MEKCDGQAMGLGVVSKPQQFSLLSKESHSVTQTNYRIHCDIQLIENEPLTHLGFKGCWSCWKYSEEHYSFMQEGNK